MSRAAVLLCMVSEQSDRQRIINKVVEVKQDYPSAKIFIIDNCSPDNTEFLEEIADIVVHTPMIDMESARHKGAELASTQGCETVDTYDFMTQG